MTYIKDIYKDRSIPINILMSLLGKVDYKSFCKRAGKINRCSIDDYLEDFKKDNLIIKERMKLICEGSLYEALKNEIYDNIIIYFNKNKKELEKNSIRYQEYRIKKKISIDKFYYFYHTSDFNKDTISIPNNGTYYTLVVDYIIDTISKKYDFSRLRDKEYITPIFESPNKLNIF